MFYNRHWYSVSKNMAYSLYNDIQVAYELEKENIDPAQRRTIQEKLNIQIKTISYTNKKRIIDHSPSETELLHDLLKKYFNLPINITFINNNDSLKIEVFQKNRIINFITNSKRVDNPTTYIFILWMTGTSILFLLLSIIFTRNQIRPIIKLARAADQFGKGRHNFYLKPEGASEIRKASIAFLKMKERIERQINSRTEMLAGVSHDLRTPLTRMKLQIAISKDNDLKQMLDDIRDMEYMINSYLDFARGDMQELPKSIYWNRFITKILEPYKTENISIQNAPKLRIALKINTLKRCFQNLIGNAFKYGDQVIINSYVNDDELYIEIHDNGIGIPADKREDVFKPFFRLDASRNQETGAVGLGLTITRDLINNHGGQIFLESSELLKGLKVVIILPL